MAYLKFSCKDGRPCFQHDGGSGYVETGNRLLALARDESALAPDSSEVDFLGRHRRMIEIRFVPALFPQNWTALAVSRGTGPQERIHLSELSARINETIGTRGEFQVADFFLYYSAAYDFQVVWSGGEGSVLQHAQPAEAMGAEELDENLVRLVYRGGLPMFTLRAANETTSDGLVLRLLSKPALRNGQSDSIDIGLHPTYDGSGQMRFSAGIKVNNSGGIPAVGLNQTFWSGLINGLNEALPQQREVDLSPVVAFLGDAYAVSVYTPQSEASAQPAETPEPARPAAGENPAATGKSPSPTGKPRLKSVTDLSIFQPLLYLLLVVILLGTLGDLVNFIMAPKETLAHLLAPLSELLIQLGNFLAGGA